MVSKQMNKALERALSPLDMAKQRAIDIAFSEGYNKKNRKFTYGGVTVKIPVHAKESDIKDLCASLMKGGSDTKLLPALKELRQELTKKKELVSEDQP